MINTNNAILPQGGISLKKLVIVLLVAAMVLGSLVGIFMYAGHGPNEDGGFADIPAPVIGSNRFLDLRGADVSMISFKDESSIFHTFTFDTGTKWPDGDKMPEAQLPGRILEQGKHLGLSLSSLAQKGITGLGVSVAVIDKPILSGHEAFGPNFRYIEVLPGHPNIGRFHFRGAAVAGLLAGRYGVAPEANLYYFAVPDDTELYVRYTEGIEKMLEFQKALPEQQQIRIAVIGQGVDPVDIASNSSGARDLNNAIDKARQEGIVVIYPGMPGLSLTGAGCPPEKDRDSPANYEVWTWTQVKREVAQMLQSQNPRSWDDAKTILAGLLTREKSLDSLQAEAINTFLYIAYMYREHIDFEEWLAMNLADSVEVLAVPVDYITVPNSTGADEYTYYGSGGLSWSTGYLAGLIALGFQVRPDATEQGIFDLLWDTGTPFEGDARLVNPTEFIYELMGL